MVTFFDSVGVDRDRRWAECTQGELRAQSPRKFRKRRQRQGRSLYFGRKIRWHEWGLIWEGDERQRKIVIDFFGMDENSKKLMLNGYENDEVKDATDSQEFDIQECRS